LLDAGDEIPVGAAGITLGASTGMDGNAFDADGFGHLGDVDGDDGIFIPAGAEFDGERIRTAARTT